MFLFSKVKEWLCLTCQTARALKDAKPFKVSTKDTITPAEPEHKVPPAPQSPQKKVSATAKLGKVEAPAKPEDEKQPSKASPQKKPQESQKTNLKEGSESKLQTGRRESAAPAAAAQPESGGLFGFGGSKPQPNAEKSESVTGKMFGFGSSIFGSASALITSAVQDQPKTTPPVSPKMSPAKEKKSPAVQKTEPSTQTKTPQMAKDKVEKVSTELPSAVSQAAVKPNIASCQLCKAELNIGSKGPSNYSTCTSCKNVVCNQCGFNPMPNESNVSKILTINTSAHTHVCTVVTHYFVLNCIIVTQFK